MSFREQLKNHITKENFDAAIHLLKSQKNLSRQEREELDFLEKQLEQLQSDRDSLLNSEKINERQNYIVSRLLNFTKEEDNVESPKQQFKINPPKASGLLLMLDILLGFIFAIWNKMMPTESIQFIQSILGDNYVVIYWCITGIIILLTFFLKNYNQKKQKDQHKLQQSFSASVVNLNSTEIDLTKIKSELIERYEKRQNYKLGKRGLPIELRIAINPEKNDNTIHFDKDAYPGTKIKLWDALNKHKHIRLLGAPGAGKTTQLLEVAIKWLKEAEEFSILPVIINLATWSKEDKFFGEWIIEILHTGYGFSKEMAKQLLEKQQLLLLLDGLDEVGSNLNNEDLKDKLRAECLLAINKFIPKRSPKYLIICSREKEYTRLDLTAPVRVALKIVPLSLSKIKGFLQKEKTNQKEIPNKTLIENLLDQLNQTPVLGEVICTPFYYNIALNFFKTSILPHALTNNKKALEQELVEHFIQSSLKPSSNPTFSSARTRKYLSWLAHYLQEHSQVTFELISFQPLHLEKQWRLVFGLVYSLVFSLVGGLVVGLVYSLVFSLVVGLVYSLVFGLVYSLVFSLVGDSEIEPKKNGKKKFDYPFKIKSLHKKKQLQICLKIGSKILKYNLKK